jgi:hypothetical protein
MKTRLLLLLIALLTGAAQAQVPQRFVGRLTLPSGQTALVAEGDDEARSTGSFSVRLYDAAAAGDETTFFRAGLVRPRDGTVERVLLADIDADGRAEIVVILRSAGSGGYLSAQAFTFDARRLGFRTMVEGLAPAADVIAALRKAARNR